tara:strand:+ start:330 stop:614 length:285 start_codon:yes stop_codon:yes gene_type:complete
MKSIIQHKPKPLTLTKRQVESIHERNPEGLPENPKKTEDLEEDYAELTVGLGDVVEKFAQPIAKMIDKVAGTDIQGCNACSKRKKYLNKKFPLS